MLELTRDSIESEMKLVQGQINDLWERLKVMHDEDRRLSERWHYLYSLLQSIEDWEHYKERNDATVQDYDRTDGYVSS